MLTSMSASMALEVKGVIEALATINTKVSLHIRMTAEMSVQQSLESKGLSTHFTQELVI